MGTIPGTRARGLGTVGTLLALLAVLVAAGCASSGSRQGDSGSRDELSREAILEVGVTNLYDVVQRLRPEWLEITGGEAVQRSAYGRGEDAPAQRRVVVVYNGSTIGDAEEVLRQLSPESVARMRYEEGEMAASTLVGGRGGYVEGAILIETRR